MLATSTVTTSLRDILLWDDNGWCYRCDKWAYAPDCDDYIVIADGCEAWFEFIASKAEYDPLLDALDVSHIPD